MNNGEQSSPRVETSKRVLEALNGGARGRWLYAVAAALGFFEVLLVMVPFEPLLIPLLAGRGKKVWAIVVYLVLGNLIAASLIYWLGAHFAAAAIEPMVSRLGAQAEYAAALEQVHERGFVSLVLADLAPLPFQVAMAAAGAVGFSFGLYLLAALISRSIRHVLLAGLVVLVGARIETWIKKHEAEIFIVGVVLFVALVVYWFLA